MATGPYPASNCSQRRRRESSRGRRKRAFPGPNRRTEPMSRGAPPSMNPEIARAIAAHRAGRLREAKSRYQRVLGLDSNDPDALNFLGMLEFQNGERERGIELVQRSLNCAPRNPHAWINLGNMLAE